MLQSMSWPGSIGTDEINAQPIAPTKLMNVRYWHKADINLRGLNVGFGGKAGIIGREDKCLLLTQSGHWAP
jgi:hypothetical protein